MPNANDPKPSERHLRQAADFVEWLGVLRELDDHAVVMMSGAYLDSTLESLLRDGLEVCKATNELLTDDRGLGSFSQRIRLSRAMDLVSEGYARELNIIRRIRNHAAHSPKRFSLSTPPCSDHIRTLAGGKKTLQSPREHREMFIASALLCTLYLTLRTAGMSAWRDFYRRPSHSDTQDSVRELMRTVGRAGEPMLGPAI